MAKKNKTKQQNVDLFGNPLNESMEQPDERPILLLTSSSEGIQKCFDFLSSKYNKTDMEKMANSIKKAFQNFRIRDKAYPDRTITRMETLFKNPYLKADYTWGMAIVMGDDENYKTYFDTFPEHIKQVWEICYRKIFVSGKEINKLTGKDTIVKTGSYYNTKYTTNEKHLCLFTISNRYFYCYKEKEPYVYMPPKLWETYNRVFAEKQVHPLSELKDDGTLLFYSNEKNLGEQLLILKQMQEQGLLEFGATKMAQTTVKKAAQRIGLDEFFPDTKDKDLKLQAAQMMIPSLASYDLHNAKTDINLYWEVIKLIMDSINVDNVAMQWISHLRGVKRDDFHRWMFLKSAIDLILRTLKLMEPQQWYSIDDIDILRRSREEIIPELISIVSARYISEERITFHGSDERLGVDEIYDFVALPVLKGFLFMLSTYGLLEVAYHVPSPAEPAYCGLDYIRLTKLGEYVFGQAKEYKGADIHNPTEYFEMDTERLIIRALEIDGKNPYEAMLKDFAEPIGARRYRVTAETFMKGCNDTYDLELKWDFIKQNVCESPSPVWESFYRDMVKRCHPLLNTGVGYTLKKIMPDNLELMRIMTTDKFIREHIIRAEKNHILIESKVLEKVKDILRKYGYIV